MSALVIPYHEDYGAPELKKFYQKFLTDGLAIAAALHFIAIGAFWVSIDSEKEKENEKRDRLRDYILAPEPTITDHQIIVGELPRGKKFDFGTPVSVPGVEVDPGKTFPTQEDLSGNTGLTEGSGEEGAILDIDEPPPVTFIAVEKDPIPIKAVQPPYPEIARRAGIQGSVVLRVWVDKEGKVRQANIVKSDADIFNQPAIDAAMQWVFAPALMKSGPVSVWVSIPFRFTLKGN